MLSIYWVKLFTITFYYILYLKAIFEYTKMRPDIFYKVFDRASQVHCSVAKYYIAIRNKISIFTQPHIMYKQHCKLNNKP